jgi:prepilin-type N-terminal cleavage/methylation domain-containing protein
MFNGLRFALYWCYIGSMVKKNGYSLIEIIVVVGIIGILTAVGVAAYNRMNMEFQVEAEAKRAAVMLRRWQKDADSGVGSPCSDGTAYEGIRVVFTSTQVSGSIVCGGTLIPVDTILFENGVEFVDSDTTLTFLPIGGGVDAASLTFGKGSIEYQVSVSAAGGIGVRKI